MFRLKFCRFLGFVLCCVDVCLLLFCVVVDVHFVLLYASGMRLGGGIGCDFFAVVWLLKLERVRLY
jgi:hypothetical protein